jgi:hypothetical protein
MLTMTASAAGDQAGFGDADVNHDGAITRREAAAFAALERAFDDIDENGNGLIERVEYARMPQTGSRPRQ